MSSYDLHAACIKLRDFTYMCVRARECALCLFNDWIEIGSTMDCEMRSTILLMNEQIEIDGISDNRACVKCVHANIQMRKRVLK